MILNKNIIYKCKKMIYIFLPDLIWRLSIHTVWKIIISIIFYYWMRKWNKSKIISYIFWKNLYFFFGKIFLENNTIFLYYLFIMIFDSFIISIISFPLLISVNRFLSFYHDNLFSFYKILILSYLIILLKKSNSRY